MFYDSQTTMLTVSGLLVSTHVYLNHHHHHVPPLSQMENYAILLSPAIHKLEKIFLSSSHFPEI